MKLSKILGLTFGLALAGGAASTAKADDWGFSVNFGYGGGGYCEPAYYPAPCYAPAPVVYYAPPVYYAPAYRPVVYGGGYCGPRYYGGGGYYRSCGPVATPYYGGRAAYYGGGGGRYYGGGRGYYRGR